MSKGADLAVAESGGRTGSDPGLRTSRLSATECAATEQLIRTMASTLGLRLEGLAIAIDEDAGRALRTYGAHGRAGANLIELDPVLFQPGSVPGRALLAHELTHAAQARTGRQQTFSPRLAESEARANAHAASLGRPLRVPLERLVGTAFEVPESAPAPPVATLADLVGRNYRRERARIERLLDGLIVTDGEVEQVLRILEPLAFETASALIGSLESDVRLRLIEQLDDSHYTRFLTPILAALNALAVEEVGRQDDGLLEHVAFTPLTLAELITVQRVFHQLPRSAQLDLLRGRRGHEFRTLQRSPPGEYDAEAARRAQAANEQQRSTGAVLDDAIEARVTRLTAELTALLRAPSEEDTRAALRLIGGLEVQPGPDPRMAAEATSSTEAESAEPQRRERDESTAGQAAVARPARSPEEEPAERARGLQMAALRHIAAELDEQGAIARLIDTLPEQDRRQPDLRDAFRLLMSARAPHLNLALVEDLLDPGWWIFGRVDRHEAMLAYNIVMSMPLVSRERFRQLEDGGTLRRMLDALPAEFRRDPDFRLPGMASSADGELIEPDRLYAPGGLRDSEAELVGTTLERFRDPEQAEDTQALLVSLLAIARLAPAGAEEVAAPRGDAVLNAVVRQLDAEGLLEPFLRRLPPDRLAARETWPEMARILGARDPMLAREHILRLLDVRSFLFISLDSVETHEAFLAFQLVRALPAVDREAIEAAEGGAPWGRMLEHLSNRTLAEAGFTYFRAQRDSDGSNAIRERLDDDLIWDGDHNDRLIAVIELARATGEFAYVFERSRALHEAGHPAPADIVARYRLYDPARQRTSPEPIETDLEVREGSNWRLLFGPRWRELDLSYVYGDPVDIMGSQYRDASVSSIRVTADLEQLQEILGGRLHTSAEATRSGDRAPVTDDNREALRSTSNVVDVVLDLERGRGLITATTIQLDNARHIAGGWTLRTGNITLTGLRLALGFERGDLIDLTSVEANLAEASVDTPVYSSGDSAVAARSASLSTLHAALGDFSQDRAESPIVGHLFGMILAAIWRTLISHRQLLEDPFERSPLFDRIELDFDSLTVNELHTSGGQRFGQTTVSDLHVAAATNRASYQRLLVTHLERRLEQTTEPASRERLQRRLDAAREEAARLAPLEREYLELVRRTHRDDDRLSDHEERRLAELQEIVEFELGHQMTGIIEVGRVSVENMDGPLRSASIVIEGIGGVASLGRDGLSVENLLINQLQVSNTHYRTDTAYLWSLGTTNLHGISLDLRIPYQASRGDRRALESRDLDTTTYIVERLHIDRIVADYLGYRGFDESGGVSKEVIVESGTIGDVNLTDFTLHMPEGQDMGYAGNLTIGTLSGLQFASHIGESLDIRGQLDRADVEGQGPAITVGIASADDITVQLDAVDLSEGTIDLRSSSGRGRVLVREASLSGDVRMVGNQILVSDFHAPWIAMPSITWTTNEGTEISATRVNLYNFRLSLDYTTVDEENSTVLINSLYVGSVTADSIVYDDAQGMRVVLTRRMDEESGNLLPLIQGLRLEELNIQMGPDSFSMSGGHGRIESADVVTSVMLQAETGTDPDHYEGLTALFANISAGGITFSDLGYGDEGLTIAGGIERLSADGSFDILPADPDTAPESATLASGQFTISQGRIGSFRYGGGVVQIGPDGGEGLIIDEIVLDSLSFRSSDYELRPIATEQDETGAASSTVTARGLEVNMDLYLRREDEEATEAEGSTARREQSLVERIDFHHLHLDSVALQGYRLFLRQKGVYIDIPAGLDTEIHDINLHGPTPEEPFSVNLDTPTPTLLGSISTGALLARQVGVQIGNSLRARFDFAADAANVGFLASTDPDSEEQGAITINLTDWSATQILAYIGDGTSTRLRAGRMLGEGGVGGEELNVELGEDGSIAVRLRGLWASGIELRDQEIAAVLRLGRVHMPEEREISYTSGPSDGPVRRGDVSTTVRIDHLDVDSADFVVPDLSHTIRVLGGRDIAHELTTTDRTPDPDEPRDTDPALLDQSVLTWIQNHQALFESLQGHIRADIQLPLSAVTSDYGTFHPEIDLDIGDGALDIDQMEEQLSSIDELGGTTVGLANLKFDPNTAEPTLVFGLGGHVPLQHTDPGGLPVGDPVDADVHYNLYEWRMSEDEMRVIRATRRIGVSRLLQAEQGNFDPDAEEEPRTDSAAWQFRGLRVNDFGLELSTDNTDPLPISLGDYGSLTLSPQALQNLVISGNLQRYNFTPFEGMRGERIFRSLHRDSTTREGNFGLSLEQLALQDLDIRIPAFGNYVEGGITGDVTINNVNNVSLDFRGLVPRWLSGQVGGVELRNVEINLEEILPYGPFLPEPEAEYRNLPVFREGEEEVVP